MGRRDHNDREPNARDEQEIDLSAEEWVEWGGQMIWAVGFTSGGAPYGLTQDEFRLARMADEADRGWARAKRGIARLFRYIIPVQEEVRVSIGRVRFLADGVASAVYMTKVELDPDVDGLSGRYVIRLPSRKADSDRDDRLRQEATLLRWLTSHDLTIRVPRVLGIVPDGSRYMMIQHFLRGRPLDLRAGRQPDLRPWEIMAGVAAAIHRIDTSDVPPAVPRHETRRDYALASLALLEHSEDPVVEEAFQWAVSHLPPDNPTCLVHGDLLGQNIIIHPAVKDEEQSPPGVLDWEYAHLGDPAYDLAIVTRGTRRPFQVERGFSRLHDAYLEAGGAPLTANDIRLYEIALVGLWYLDTLASGAVEESEKFRNQLLRILKIV